jgi:hypothetical protein
MVAEPSKEVFSMLKQLWLTEDEQELIVKGLYDWRNALEPDCLLRPELEELILKVIDAPAKKSCFRRRFT